MKPDTSSTASVPDYHGQRADRLMVGVLWLAVGFSLLLGLFNGSLTLALTLGLPSVLLPVYLARMSPGALITRLSVAVALMSMAALFIQQTNGLIEAHFSIFVFLAFLLVYRAIGDQSCWPRLSLQYTTPCSICRPSPSGAGLSLHKARM